MGRPPQPLARCQLGHAIPRRYGPRPATPRHPSGRDQQAIEHATARSSRHPDGRRTIDLDDTYRRLAQTWTHEQLAARYEDARCRGAGILGHGEELTRPLALLATAIPPVATLNVAIHVLHVLPQGARDGLDLELITTAEKNAADALHRCHRALELDGNAHGYTAEDWLATVYDIALPLLESARGDHEPPTIVGLTQEAVSWLSRSVLELDRSSPETPTAIAEALTRMLCVWLFTDLARQRQAPDDR